ncbi:MAG: hypothetical protein WCO06_06885 [Candidatus Roizmanbacteria bacterium]
MALLNARPLIQHLISDPDLDQKIENTDGDRFGIALSGLNILARRLNLHLPDWQYFYVGQCRNGEIEIQHADTTKRRYSLKGQTEHRGEFNLGLAYHAFPNGITIIQATSSPPSKYGNYTQSIFIKRAN